MVGATWLCTRSLTGCTITHDSQTWRRSFSSLKVELLTRGSTNQYKPPSPGSPVCSAIFSCWNSGDSWGTIRCLPEVWLTSFATRNLDKHIQYFAQWILWKILKFWRYKPWRCIKWEGPKAQYPSDGSNNQTKLEKTYLSNFRKLKVYLWICKLAFCDIFFVNGSAGWQIKPCWLKWLS